MPTETRYTLGAIHKDLLTAQDLVFTPCGFDVTTPVMEAESQEYDACRFKLNGLSVIYRVAKITPTKTGQFVTIWKRSENGPIAPFDISDEMDMIVVSTRKNDQLGQFVFPKSVLAEQGIISVNNKEGKRGIRVYPPWDITTNKQAQKTQRWQLNYFLSIKETGTIDLTFARQLYQRNHL